MSAFRYLLALSLIAVAAEAQSVRHHFAPAPAKSSRPVSEANYARLELGQVAAPSSGMQGRRVTFTAEVIAYDARMQSVEVHDARSKAVVRVLLNNLTRAQRQEIVRQQVMDLTVYGRVVNQNGKMVVAAHRVDPILTDLAPVKYSR